MDKSYADFRTKELIIEVLMRLDRIENMIHRLNGAPQTNKKRFDEIKSWWGIQTPYQNTFSSTGNSAVVAPKGPKDPGRCCGGACGK